MTKRKARDTATTRQNARALSDDQLDQVSGGINVDVFLRPISIDGEQARTPQQDGAGLIKTSG